LRGSGKKDARAAGRGNAEATRTHHFQGMVDHSYTNLYKLCTGCYFCEGGYYFYARL
jgi:hypothetical protein